MKSIVFTYLLALKKTTLTLLLLFGAILLRAQHPVPLILDTDMANDCDDAGALAVLNSLEDLGETQILAVVTNRKDLTNASGAAVDAINTFYGRPDIPIGTSKYGGIGNPKPSSFTLALKNEFPHDSPTDDQLPDALEIYRKTLATQPDSSVVICSIGLLTNLADLISSPPDRHSPLTGKELVQRKVKSTVIMGGGFPRSSQPETNIKLDAVASIKVANEWPGRILWQGFEIGLVINTGEALKQVKDKNPIKSAYELKPFRGGQAIDLGKPSHDQITALLSVRGLEEKLWDLSEPGNIVISSDGHTDWKYNPNALQHFVIMKTHPKTLENTIENLMLKPAMNRN